MTDDNPRWLEDRALWLDGDARWLDANAIAGLLQELFGAELTAMPRGCQSCGQVHPLGAHRLHRGAGLVLRCPACGDVALRIVTLSDRRILHLEGAWRIVLKSGREDQPGG